jgi:glycosyltransferase involved in cell wall biosynthesis
MSHPIGIDTRMIACTGIGTYLRGLLGAFEGIRPRVFGIGLYGGNTEILGQSSFPRHSFPAPIYSIREQLGYPSRVSSVKLWHAPHYNIPLWTGKAKLVVTIHDLIHWVFRGQFFSAAQGFYAGFMINRALRAADHVIAVSEHTRNDLVGYFGAEPEKITVIYEGVDPRFRKNVDSGSCDRVRRKYGIGESYFLYVGNLKPHKNVLWLWDFFRQARAGGGIRSSLVVIGKKNDRYPRRYQRYSEIRSDHDMIYIPEVDFQELTALYGGARALIHPSLYEGFGLTLLEAMACGAPVIAFRVASIPEVTGEAAYLVTADSQDEMYRAVSRMENDAACREEYIRKGFRMAAKYRWEDAARKTLEVYEKVLGGKKDARSKIQDPR